MTPTHRWMILGGAAVSVVVIAIVIFFLDTATSNGRV